MLERVKPIVSRHSELTELLSVPDVFSDAKKFKKISKEHSKLEPIVSLWKKIEELETQISDSQELLNDDDSEIKAMAKADLELLHEQKLKLEDELTVMILPKNPDDHLNTILEIRAGTGGDEATIFVADLVRMYTQYAVKNNWKIEVLSLNPNGVGGYKEFIALITGENVYAKMKYEIGVHRVQRVPVTESQGRVHTSAVSIAVLPEREEVEIEINQQDLRIDTYRSQGAGGQHVNTTDSAIRITHIPTGIVVTCQEERSQIKNRAKAMKYLNSKLYDTELEKQASEESEKRKSMVGSGDRSERIRTYNYPQDRMTDHRVKLTLYNLEEMMRAGDISQVTSCLAEAEINARLKEQEKNPIFQIV